MRKLFSLIFRLVGILFLLAVAGGTYYFSKPENRLVFAMGKEVFQIGQFREQFKNENIAKTCGSSFEGQYYEKCYLAKEKEFLADRNLTMSGIVLTSVAATGVLIQDKKVLENKTTGITRADFLMLGRIITTLNAIRAYEIRIPEEQKMKDDLIEKMVKTYSDMSAKVDEKLARMPAQEGNTYKQLLVQYNAAIIPPPTL